VGVVGAILCLLLPLFISMAPPITSATPISRQRSNRNAPSEVAPTPRRRSRNGNHSDIPIHSSKRPKRRKENNVCIIVTPRSPPRAFLAVRGIHHGVVQMDANHSLRWDPPLPPCHHSWIVGYEIEICSAWCYRQGS
jgi:hypothetical protein